MHRQCWCGANSAVEAVRFDTPGLGVHAMVQCVGCGVLALHPQPDDQTLSRAYSPEYYGSSPRKFVGPVAKVISWFQGGRARLAGRLMPAGGAVLDVGCGNGGFLLQMRRRGHAAQGTEWTAQSAARVPASAGVTVHVGDLPDLHLPAASFDLISFWHVFEHLRDPHAALVEAGRLLAPGGALLMAMPNAEGAQARRFGCHWLHHDPPRHLFGFGPSSLTALLRQTGFRIERLSTFSLEQNPFGWLQSLLNQRGHPRDRLYNLLKGLSSDPLLTRLGDLTRFGLLAAPAVIISTLESLRGQGATMTLVARSISD